MARHCPKDQVRALVEGTLDLEESLSQDVLQHVESCPSCAKLRSKLESKERAFRAALSAFVKDESAECPSPADIASVSERGLDSADERLVDHIARCATCRMTLSAVSTAGAAAPRTPDETIAAARRRVAITRADASAARSEPPARTPSGRALANRAPSGRRPARTTRQVALFEDRSSKTSLVAAAVACAIVGFVYIAFVHDATPPPSSDETTTSATTTQPQVPTTPPIRPETPRFRPIERPAPSVPVPAQQPSPQGKDQAEDQIVAQATPVPSPLEPRVEEEPREEPAPSLPAPPAPQPRPDAAPSTPPPVTTHQAPPSTEHSAPTPPPVAPVAPRPERGELASAGAGELACAAVSGPIEVRKKAEKTWRRIAVADLVRDGDALRARGEDASITFSDKARIAFDGDSQGSVEVTSTGVKILLESGGMEGETLAYDGLEVSEANGFATAWKGSRLRLEVTEKGLRVCVAKGSVNVGNDLGKVTVHTGQEITVIKDRKPERPTSLRGPYRSTPSHAR